MAASNFKLAQRAERERLGTLGLKKCYRCQETLPHDRFGKASREWDGRRNECIDCRKAEHVASYARNRDQVLQRQREHYEANKEVILKRHKAYREGVEQVCATEGCQNRAHTNAHGSICTRCIWRRDHWGTVDDSGRPEVKWPAGRDHYAWLGDSAGYQTVHARIYRTRGRAAEFPCVDCGAQAEEWSYRGGSERELTGLTQNGKYTVRYSPDPDDYQARCVPCHRKYDSRHRKELISA